MTPKLVTTEKGQYEPAPWLGTNSSGMAPLNDKVVVRSDQAASTVGSKGLIRATEDQQDRQSMASTTGTVYAVGDKAFEHDKDRLKPGDRVVFEQYAGVVHKGLDGAIYRLMSEASIGGRLIEMETSNG